MSRNRCRAVEFLSLPVCVSLSLSPYSNLGLLETLWCDFLRWASLSGCGREDVFRPGGGVSI